MNKRGQALVEFVIILPILLLVIFAFIDFGRIILCKSHLENLMDDAITLINDNKDIKTLVSNDEYHVTYDIQDGKYKKIILKSKLELITPGLKKILKNPYTVLVERSIIYE